MIFIDNQCHQPYFSRRAEIMHLPCHMIRGRWSYRLGAIGACMLRNGRTGATPILTEFDPTIVCGFPRLYFCLYSVSRTPIVCVLFVHGRRHPKQRCCGSGHWLAFVCGWSAGFLLVENGALRGVHSLRGWNNTQHGAHAIFAEPGTTPFRVFVRRTLVFLEP